MISAEQATKISLEQSCRDAVANELMKLDEKVKSAAWLGKIELEHHLRDTNWYNLVYGRPCPELKASDQAAMLRKELEGLGYVVEWKEHYEELQLVDWHLVLVLKWG